MNKHLILIAVFGLYVAINSLWFLSTSGELLILVMGVSMGVGLVGMTMSALKLIRPDRYLFVYEVDGYEHS